MLFRSVYHLQRTGIAGNISICALNNPPLKALKDNKEFSRAFPGQAFIPYPSLSEPEDKNFPGLYKDVLKDMKPRQAVVVAMPDQLHYQVVMDALKNNQNVLCVKPLVLNYNQSEEIREIARKRGLFVGIEYHKRFDKRSLMARSQYAQGHFGEFIMGEAKMIEPYLYRFSNFQNWFTTDKTDPFTYVGCHYVDLVYYITGLKPVEVSVIGIKGKFPNGNSGYLWSQGRVLYENGAILSVIDGLGYPDEGAGSNEQCLTMFCEGKGRTGMIKHNDQYRGVTHSYLEGIGVAGSNFNFINPDFYQLLPWEGEGYKPSGYGYDSIAATIDTIYRMENNTAAYPEDRAMEVRRRTIEETDKKGIIATPANSFINELVVEAARKSILNNGLSVRIAYDERPHIE